MVFPDGPDVDEVPIGEGRLLLELGGGYRASGIAVGDCAIVHTTQTAKIVRTIPAG